MMGDIRQMVVMMLKLFSYKYNGKCRNMQRNTDFVVHDEAMFPLNITEYGNRPGGHCHVKVVRTCHEIIRKNGEKRKKVSI